MSSFYLVIFYENFSLHLYLKNNPFTEIMTIFLVYEYHQGDLFWGSVVVTVWTSYIFMKLEG